MIIPFYCGVDWLIEALDSALNQTYENTEIIVINDGSKEDLTEVLNKYSDKIIYIEKENGGPASARNAGLAKATGSYIAFLDSDDIWYVNKLEIQINKMEAEDYIWSHTSYETFCNNKIISRISVKNFNGVIYPKMLASSPLATPCIVIKKEIFEKNKNLRFNEKLRYGQDSNLWIQIAVEYPILAIDNVLVKVRMRGTNAGKRAVVQIKSRCSSWEYLNKNRILFEPEKLPFLHKTAYRISCICGVIVKQVEIMKLQENNIEIIAKLLYFLPWLLFKFSSKLWYKS